MGTKTRRINPPAGTYVMAWDLAKESANWAGDHFSAYYCIARVVDSEIGRTAGVNNPESPYRDNLDPAVMNEDAERYRQIFPLVKSIAQNIINFRTIRSNCAGWSWQLDKFSLTERAYIQMRIKTDGRKGVRLGWRNGLLGKIQKRLRTMKGR